MMTHDEILAVVTAHRDKKDIQFREIGAAAWGDYSTEFKRGSLEELIRDLDTDVFEFRAKPEPRRGFVADVFVYPTEAAARTCFPEANIVEVV